MVSSSSSSSSSSTGGRAQSLLRIHRELKEIESEPNPYWCAYPLDLDEPYEWHFTIRGPADTEFAGGLYHGRIVLPQSYPFMPPSVLLLTQNGRFEVGKKVCLSASNYHPELWQPAWGLRTMLDALHAFFPTPGEGALHSLDWPADVRRKIAKESVEWSCPFCKQTNKLLVNTKCSSASTSRPSLPADIKNIGHSRMPGNPSPTSSSSPTVNFLSNSDTTSSFLLPPPPTSPTINSSSSSSSSSSTFFFDNSSNGIASSSSTSTSSSSSSSSSTSSSSSSSDSLLPPSLPPSSTESQSSSSEATPSPTFDNTSSSSSSSVGVRNRRVRPERSTNGPLHQLLKYPQNIWDFGICGADFVIVLLLASIFVLMLDLVFRPPGSLTKL